MNQGIHQLAYRFDTGLFLPLAIPGLNLWLINQLLTIGNSPAIGGDTLAASLIGLVGVLGLSFAVLRTRVSDSRDMVLISAVSKIAACYWLFTAYQNVSVVFALLLLSDMALAGIYLFAARRS